MWAQAATRLLTSPRWPHVVRSVVNDQLEVVQQQDVDACGGGDPCSVCRGERRKWVRRQQELVAIRASHRAITLRGRGRHTYAKREMEKSAK